MALQAFGPSNEITPELFQRSMQSGAQLGASLREQDIKQAEAGDNLRLAYAQLESSEKQKSQESMAKLQLAHATLEHKQEQADLLNEYRQKSLEQRTQAASDLMDFRERSLSQRQAEGEAGGPKVHFGTNGEVLRQEKDGTVTQLRPPRTKENVHFDAPSGKWFRVTQEGGVEEVAPKELPKPAPPAPAPGLMDRLRSMLGSGGQSQPGLTKPATATTPPAEGWPAGSIPPGMTGSTDEPSLAPSPKPLDKATATDFLKQAKGDKAKARQLAKDAGYDF